MTEPSREVPHLDINSFEIKLHTCAPSREIFQRLPQELLGLRNKHRATSGLGTVHDPKSIKSSQVKLLITTNAFCIVQRATAQSKT
jgi:hypothetical protein